MPLFQPSNITPSSFAGVGGGTVAVADKVKITWQVNGNVPMTAYKIDIFDMGNNLIHTSGFLTDDNTPFYPTDNKGNPQYFSYEPNFTWADFGLSDGNEYTLQITQAWGSNLDEYVHTTTQISQSAFITRTKPTVEIINSNSNLKTVLAYEITDLGAISGLRYSKIIDNDEVYYVTFYFEELTSKGDIVIVSRKKDGVVTSSGDIEGSIYYRLSGKWYKTNTIFQDEPPTFNGSIEGGLKFFARLPITKSPITTISATYYQAQEDSISTTRWDIHTFNVETKSIGDLVYDTGVVNTANLLNFELPSFGKDDVYLIRCTIETENGVQVGTGVALFVWYNDGIEDFSATETRFYKNEGAILFNINASISAEVLLYNIENYKATLIYKENYKQFGKLKLYSIKNYQTPIFELFGVVGNNYPAYAGTYTKRHTIFTGKYYTSNCYLYVTEKDANLDNVYHVVTTWRFGNNLNFGSVSNNNSPNFLSNFTGYRLKQPTVRKGKSGTLQALLSNSVNGMYQDTALQMENLYKISECKNPMFLKDTKGNLYMVSISAPIVQTVNNKTQNQEVTVSITWEEVGSADGVSIVQLPTDQGWIDDNAQLSEVRLEVDNETGMLRVIYPEQYNYFTTFGLVRPNLYARTADGVEEADLELIDGAVILNDED